MVWKVVWVWVYVRYENKKQMRCKYSSLGNRVSYREANRYCLTERDLFVKKFHDHPPTLPLLPILCTLFVKSSWSHLSLTFTETVYFTLRLQGKTGVEFRVLLPYLGITCDNFIRILYGLISQYFKKIKGLHTVIGLRNSTLNPNPDKK